MKTFFTVLFSFMALAASAAEADNAIRVTTGYDHAQAYRKAGQALTLLGYTISHADIDMGAISTAEKTFHRSLLRKEAITVMFLTINDGKIIIIGEYREDSVFERDDSVFERADNKGSRRSKGAKTWELMEEIAEAIGGTIETIRL